MQYKQQVEKADEILDVLKMWDISLDDAKSIIKLMEIRIDNENEMTWINPLAGTGFKISDEDEPSLPGLGAPLKAN